MMSGAIKLNIIAMAMLCMALAVQSLTACGANHREKTIKATLIAVNAQRDSLVELDAKIQAAIVASCVPGTCSPAEGARRLEAYRNARTPLVPAFEAAYRAIAVATTLNDDHKSLTAVLDAAKQIKDLIDALQQFGATPQPSASPAPSPEATP